MGRHVDSTMLNEMNLDRTCGRMCPLCGFQLPLITRNSWDTWPPIATCPAPWRGGYTSDRSFAVVNECPECFELSWHHVDYENKQRAEALIK